MFKSLSRLFGSTSKAPRLSNTVPGATSAQVGTSPVGAPAPTASTSAKEKWKQNAAKAPVRNATPEQLCGITPEMTPDQIRARLAELYQRHNRAASSFDPKLCAEAEIMLETLAGLRDKYFGSPVTP